MLNELETSPYPVPTLAAYTSGDKSVSVFVVRHIMALNQSEIHINPNMFTIFRECFRSKIRKRKPVLHYNFILGYIHFTDIHLAKLQYKVFVLR